MKKLSSKIIIIGAGPAGCAVGSLLARAGYEVLIYDEFERPELVVGESLIPAMLPYLGELGVLDKIEAIGTKKPGATIYLDDLDPWDISFSESSKSPFKHAYNVPRKEFDKILFDVAIQAGCRIEKKKVKLNASKEDDLVWIDEYSQDQIFIDATGRKRLVSNALGLKQIAGKRNDIALFAHLNKADLPYGGNIHMNVFKEGWSWRIPLVDKVSVGFVANRRYFDQFGESRFEQYDSLLKEDFIKSTVTDAERITDVVKYSNYQLQSERLFGANWILLGDAAGFLDPVFSTGLFLSLKGANSLVENLTRNSLDIYQQGVLKSLSSWGKLIDSFYDESFFSMIKSGLDWRSKSPLKFEKLNFNGFFSEIISGYGMEDSEIQEKFETILRFFANPNTSKKNESVEETKF